MLKKYQGGNEPHYKHHCDGRRMPKNVEIRYKDVHVIMYTKTDDTRRIATMGKNGKSCIENIPVVAVQHITFCPFCGVNIENEEKP